VLADVAIVLFLVGCVLIGFFRGALRQLIALGAWLVAFVVAAQGRNFLGDYLRAQEPDFSVQYAQMLSFLVTFAILFLAALAIIELSGRTITLSTRPVVEEVIGGGTMLFVGVLALTAVLIALGTFYGLVDFRPRPGPFSTEVDLVRQLNAALADSKIVAVLRDTLVPAVQSLLGPLLPPDVRQFG
jgi:membrane protein required for colicin V production